MIWVILLFTWSCIPVLGFFGNQAVRLLRESWDGILKADSKGIIRPTGASALAQELYSMLDDSLPQQQNGPVTMNPPPGTTAMTINTQDGGNALAITGGNLSIGKGASFTVCKNGYLDQEQFRLSGNETRLGLSGNELATDTKCPAGDVLKANGDGVTVTGDLNLNGGFYKWNGVPLAFKGGTGTTVFLARVVSGMGNTYLVDIYGNGSGRPPTNPLAGNPVSITDPEPHPPVTATVPQIADEEQIPAGTWISALYQFDNANEITYEFQIPIWLS